MQISKIQQPRIFAQKFQISIRSDFSNQLFLQECVHGGVYFGAHIVLSVEHFLKIVSGLQMAWPYNQVIRMQLAIKSWIAAILLYCCKVFQLLQRLFDA